MRQAPIRPALLVSVDVAMIESSFTTLSEYFLMPMQMGRVS